MPIEDEYEDERATTSFSTDNEFSWGRIRLSDLGKWYEIARFDHSFERGQSRVSAEYSLRDDGAVRVLNRGYSAAEKVWQEAEGKARFAKGADQGFLKVSFFGPFYGSYVVFELDADYQHALVCGPDRSYLWILARTPQMKAETRDAIVREKG
jgi:apolipoprotein D and lipocalin family protein